LFNIFAYVKDDDAPPSTLMDSTTNPNLKTTKKERVRAHSLTHNTSRVEGRVRVSRWD
jgi:hypothetical protein